MKIVLVVISLLLFPAALAIFLSYPADTVLTFLIFRPALMGVWIFGVVTLVTRAKWWVLSKFHSRQKAETLPFNTKSFFSRESNLILYILLILYLVFILFKLIQHTPIESFSAAPFSMGSGLGAYLAIRYLEADARKKTSKTQPAEP